LTYYYAALQAVRQQGEDLTSWLEYTAEGLLLIVHPSSFVISP
jgi:hypothetical protein